MRGLRGVAAFALAAFLLAACARTPPPSEGPAAGAAPPALATSRSAAALATYRAADGRELAYLVWRNPEMPASTAIVLVHGLEGHADWLAPTAARLSGLGYHVYGLDRRGAGLNREDRGFASGDAASADQMLADLDAFVRQIRPHYDRVVLAGFSWGAKPVLAYGLAHPDLLDGLVLIAPELAARQELPLTARARLLGAERLAPGTMIELPFAPDLLATDPAWRAHLAADPLRLRQVTARLLAISRELDRGIAQGAAGRNVPTLLLLAGGDRIADNDAALALLRQGAPITLATLAYPDQPHGLPFAIPDRLAWDIQGWLEGSGDLRLVPEAGPP